MAYITVKQELNFEELKEQCWCEAIDTLNRIEEEDKEDDLIAFLVDCFSSYNSIPTLTEINDLLRFEDEYVFERLEIDLIKKHDIDDLSGESYFNALENYLNEFAPYDEEMDKLKNWLWENCSTSATNWTAGATKTIYSAIKENCIDFDADGNIIND